MGRGEIGMQREEEVGVGGVLPFKGTERDHIACQGTACHVQG